MATLERSVVATLGRSEEPGFCAKWPKGPLVGGTFVSRLPFLLAAALVAAGLGDPFVESVANTGIFGGHYADNNHLGVIPTLLAGAIVALEVLVLRFLEVWRRSTSGSGDPLIDIARDIGAGSLARDFPLIFALQLLSLFVLESAEQLLAAGKFLGGAAWLGGPIAFSLIAHAIIGGSCAFALGASMRAIVRTFATLVQTANRSIWFAIPRVCGGPLRLDLRDISCARTQAPHVREIGGRAPPLLQTLA